MQTKLEIELIQEKIKNKLFSISSLDIKNEEELYKLLKDDEFINRCEVKLQSIKDSEASYFNKWQTFEKSEIVKAFKKKRYYQYNTKINSLDKSLSIICSRGNLNPKHMEFEILLKEHVHKNLLHYSNLSSKTALVWLSPDLVVDDSVLYREKNRMYGLSMLSNVRNIPTGNLTVREVINAKNTNEPIIHEVDGKEVLTWVVSLYNQKNSSLIVHSVNKEELEKKSNASFLFLFSETLIAIIISFILILLLFKRVLKNINTITSTAVLVNKGNKNIRSKVKGNDDIGILGQSFDSMLDFFENSIKILDSKVEEKTKELSKSLEEKELLLKEIHHRVKNNLALTIALIELQEEDIEDEQTKKVLVDIQERIYTMELLHRKLYESTNLNEIPLENYIVDLVASITRAYDINRQISIEYKIDDIYLNIETAMPLGIIINELVTNSFKYAFDDNKENKLQIEISKQNSFITMIVIDNGKGLREEFTDAPSTLGLKLINSIVMFQLQGSFDYVYENGAKFIIKGNIKEENPMCVI